MRENKRERTKKNEKKQQQLKTFIFAQFVGIKKANINEQSK